MAENIATDKPIGTFTINILDVKTTAVGDMQNVVKLVTWSIELSKGGKVETASGYTTELPDPTPETFTPFSEITLAQLVSWIEATDERLPGIKVYLESKIDTELAKASLESKPLPWAAAA